MRRRRTSDTDVARSAVDRSLDLTMDDIVTGVAIDLAESPNLVAALCVLRHRINTLGLAHLIGDEDLTAKLVGHVRF